MATTLRGFVAASVLIAVLVIAFASSRVAAPLVGPQGIVSVHGVPATRGQPVPAPPNQHEYVAEGSSTQRPSGSGALPVTEEGSAKLTDWLQGLSAVASAVFAAGLLILGRGQLKIADRQVGIMEMQNSIAAKAVDISIAQKEIARQQYLLANQPNLKVRISHYTVGPYPDFPFTIHLRVTNTGSGDAFVTEGVLNIMMVEPKKEFRSVQSAVKLPVVYSLSSGETKQIELPFDAGIYITSLFRTYRNRVETFLYGYYTYSGLSGQVHQVGFEWRYDALGKGVQNFVKTDDTEHNYSF